MSVQRDATLDEVQTIFRDFFMQDGIVLENSSTMDDIAGWDSLTQISLMLAVQQKFAIRFTARDQHALKNVGDLVALVNGKKEAVLF